jgi:hypothetical protein
MNPAPYVGITRLSTVILAYNRADKQWPPFEVKLIVDNTKPWNQVCDEQANACLS